MSTGFVCRRFCGVLLLTCWALILTQSSVDAAEPVKRGKVIRPRADMVEKIDKDTGDILALPIVQWKELGEKEGRYKNPMTGKYTMVPVMTCPVCKEKIPKYLTDTSAEEVLQAMREHKCSKCGESTLPGGKLSTEDELRVWLECAARSYDKVKSYTATFYKRERVDGELLPEERIQLKFKKPFMVYMKWVGKANKGQECLYVRGKYDNELVARGSGLKSLVVVKLDPKGKTAMSGTRHPITDAGIGHLIALLTKDRERAARYGEGKVANKGQKKLKTRRGTPVRRVQKFSCILPKDKRKEYYCHRAEIAFDVGSGLPVSISIYDGSGKLLEHYRYENLKINPGLTDKDFDRKNRDYRL